MTDVEQPEDYWRGPETGQQRLPWIVAGLSLMLAAGAGIWGWTAQDSGAEARAALSAALTERDQAATEAKQWRTLLDQAESAAQGTDAKVAELEQRVRSLDELLQTANTEVSRLESELASRAGEGVASEEPPEAAVAVTALPESGGSLGTVEPAPAPAPLAAVEPAAAPPAAAPESPAPRALVPEPVTAVAGDARSLAIVFDVNSSYLPQGLGGQLKDFAATLEPGKAYQIELVGSVGHPDVEGQSAEEALRYNRWMAERRMTRVAEFLQKNARTESLTFRQDFALNDPSRRVLVEARPVVN